MFGDCLTCQQLWDEYAAATTRHIDLKGKVEIAQLEHNDQVVRELATQLKAAKDHCEKARTALQEHRKTHEPKVLPAKDSGQ